MDKQKFRSAAFAQYLEGNFRGARKDEPKTVVAKQYALWENQAIAQRVISSFWAISDICLPSIDDEMNLFNETAEQVQDRFLGMSKSGALKRGETGPLSLQPNAEVQEFSSAKQVVDSTAAGDSFNGGYLGSILSGSTQFDALQAAHKLASHVIGYRGAIVPE